MTLLFKKITTAALSLAMVGGVILSVGTTVDNSNYQPNAQATQTNMRIYAYLKSAWDTVGGQIKMYITYENTVITPIPYDSAVEMTKVVSDYWEGLFYYDVPIGFDNDDQFRLRNSTGLWPGKDSNQSGYIYFKDLVQSGDYKGVSIGAWVADNTPRVAVIENTIPVNSGQAAAVLAKIDSCDPSFANGYNAWPQLNDLFIIPSTLVGSTEVNDTVFGALETTTISNKIAMLSAEYTQNL